MGMATVEKWEAETGSPYRNGCGCLAVLGMQATSTSRAFLYFYEYISVWYNLYIILLCSLCHAWSYFDLFLVKIMSLVFIIFFSPSFLIQKKHWHIWKVHLDLRKKEKQKMVNAAQYYNTVIIGQCLHAWMQYWQCQQAKKQQKSKNWLWHSKNFHHSLFLTDDLKCTLFQQCLSLHFTYIEIF